MKILTVERKFADGERATNAYGPFKDQWSANQYYEIMLKPHIDTGVNLNFIELETPEGFGIDSASWMVQFT